MEAKEKVSILYEKNKNHITAPITGAWGGISPDGSYINMSLYLDQVTLPNYQNVEVKDGTLNLSQLENITRGDFTREVFGTFTLTSEVARALAEWLNNKADDLDKRKSEGKK